MHPYMVNQAARSSAHRRGSVGPAYSTLGQHWDDAGRAAWSARVYSADRFTCTYVCHRCCEEEWWFALYPAGIGQLGLIRDASELEPP